MSTVPADMAAARALLIRYLDAHPGVDVPADLDPDEVGIVGDPSHDGGYHVGRDRVRRNSAGVIVDYSVVESALDLAGLTLEASALDIGQFGITSNGRRWTLLDFNLWLVGECVRGAPDTRWIREVIYTPDGVVVLRWDRLGIRSTGDSTHLTHTHVSGFRTRDRSQPVKLVTRWLEHIGVVSVAVTDDDVRRIAQGTWELFRAPVGPDGTGYNMQDHVLKTEFGVAELKTAVAALRAVADATAADVKAALELLNTAGGNADVIAILAGVDRRLAALRTAVDEDTRDTVVDYALGGSDRVEENRPAPVEDGGGGPPG